LNFQAAQNDATHNEHYQRGVEKYHSGRYTEAIEELEQAARQDARNEWTPLLKNLWLKFMHE
jgi:outer membrane protein assembly factor BamD (BamD/ComL family)